MKSSLTNQEKAKFLLRVAERYDVGEQSAKLLVVMAKYISILPSFVFTQNCLKAGCKYGLLITSSCSDEGCTVVLFKDRRIWAEGNYQNIVGLLNKIANETVHVEFRYKGSEEDPSYLLLIDEPREVSSAVSDEIDDLLHYVQNQAKMKEIDKAIDASLDNRDKEAFLRLCKEREKIMNQ